MRVIDFCCGAGGLSLGMLMAGHQVLAAYDNDPDAVECYRRNIGDHVHIADLRDLVAAGLPEVDGYIGGVPCQPFSRLTNGEPGQRDPRNMLPEFRRLVVEGQPKFFLLENVPDLLVSHGAYLASELVALERAGYWCLPFILNASMYGVPQERRRLFVIGMRGHMPIIPAPKNSRRSAMTTRQAIGHMLSKPEKLPNFLSHLGARPDKLIDGANRSDHGNGVRKVQWRSLDRPSFTILASGNYRHKACVDGLTYTLRARHLAAIQSFPPTWEWPEGYDKAKRLIGNAVPPLLARALGEALNV